ncbi:MAG: hypothetical protein HC817_04415 [Saprospiraceae bacterium]|nr:hypothetical protein [Saprospiraceae bacterium]
MIKADSPNTPTHCFNLLWSTVNEKYAFFDYKEIDWDSVRRVNAPKISDSMSQDSLFKVLSSMLSALRDGHVNLATTVNRSRYWSWREAFPDNYNPNFIFRHYFKSDFHLTGNLPNQILPDSIGLVAYSSFSSPIPDIHIDYVMKRFEHCKGIIIDVRDNGGGAMSYVFKLMSRFIDKKMIAGYAHLKMAWAKTISPKQNRFLWRLTNGQSPF